MKNLFEATFIQVFRSRRSGLRVIWIFVMLLLSCQRALAVNYVFPGNLPTGCSGGSGNYTCGSLTLNWGDTISLGAPATITVNGNFVTNNNSVNSPGSAANLTLLVTGTMSGGFTTTINANIRAGAVVDTQNQVSYGGSLTTTTGTISLQANSSVAGNISTTSGNISLGGSTSVGGNISSNSGNVTLSGYNTISGNITTGGTVYVGYGVRIGGNVTALSVSEPIFTSGSVTYGGNISATSGIVALQWGSTVAGNITSTSGAISLNGGNGVGGRIASGTGGISLGYGVHVNGGGLSSAGNITVGQDNVIRGEVGTNGGAVIIGPGARVNGDISSNGSLSVGQGCIIDGNLVSSLSYVSVGYATRINGDVAAPGPIDLKQNSVVTGNVIGSSGRVEVEYGATVMGNITTSSGQIEFQQNSVVDGCVTSTNSAQITLGYQAKINSVCCGSRCSTSCVQNYSTYRMPARCTVTEPPVLNYFPIPVSPLNENITTWTNGSVYSGWFNGIHTLGGVPFDLQTDSDGDNVFWGTDLNISNYVGPSSLTLTLATNLYGATTVYTLINTAWGTIGSNVGSITFNASNGDTYTVQLVEGINVRDHYNGSFVNTVSSTSVTKNVIGSDVLRTAHLDMQAFTLPASFASETLSSIVFTSSGGTATGLPFLAGLTVKAQTQGSATVTVVPSGFNCVESGAAALNGHLYTKLAGTPFTFDVVALKDTNNDGSADAVETSYASDKDRSVTVELIDASSGTPCATAPALDPAVNQTLTFPQAAQASNLGRKSSAAMLVNAAHPNLRCRVTDASQTSAVVACSTDNFSVRPTDFTVTSDANGSSTVKAGAAFSLTAASGATGYNGAPKIDGGKIGAHSGATVTGTLSGSFSAADVATGTATGGAFSYSEVGYFHFSAQGVYDDSFTAVDSVTGDCSPDFSNASVGGLYGCKFGNQAATADFGRFIPDHFDVALNTPVFAASCGSFSYVGQPVKYATIPVATLSAKNLAGTMTRNYTGNYWKIDPASGSYGITGSYTEASHALTVLNGTLPVALDGGNGSGTLSFGNTTGNILAVTRGNPIAPFNAEIALSFSLRDTDGVTANSNPISFGTASAGNGIAFSGGGKAMRWGRLVLGNAYGSELLPLPMGLYAEYFDGSSFVSNSSDNCSNLSLSTNLMLSNPTTASGASKPGNTVMIVGSGTSQATLANSTLSAGEAGLSFSAPAAGNTGYIDVSGNFSSLPWLLFDWDHNGAHDNSPSARASFGLYNGGEMQIYRREVY